MNNILNSNTGIFRFFCLDFGSSGFLTDAQKYNVLLLLLKFVFKPGRSGPSFWREIIFNDEASFNLGRFVNKQNCRIWEEMQERQMHPQIRFAELYGNFYLTGRHCYYSQW